MYSRLTGQSVGAIHLPSCNIGTSVGHSHRGTHWRVQNVTRVEQVRVHALPQSFHTCPPAHGGGAAVVVVVAVQASSLTQRPRCQIGRCAGQTQRERGVDLQEGRRLLHVRLQLLARITQT